MYERDFFKLFGATILLFPAFGYVNDNHLLVLFGLQIPAFALTSYFTSKLADKKHLLLPVFLISCTYWVGITLGGLGGRDGGAAMSLSIAGIISLWMIFRRDALDGNFRYWTTAGVFTLIFALLSFFAFRDQMGIFQMIFVWIYLPGTVYLLMKGKYWSSISQAALIIMGLLLLLMSGRSLLWIVPLMYVASYFQLRQIILVNSSAQ